MTKLPRLFIGSSTEGLSVAQAIAWQLRYDVRAKIWDECFHLGQSTLESLVERAGEFSFAVMVVTPDDLVASRDTLAPAPRDNVMFELGLFMGKLGRRRTFVVCDNSQAMKLPSDLAGVTVAPFDGTREDLTSAVGPPCYLVRQAVKLFRSREEETPPDKPEEDGIKVLVMVIARALTEIGGQLNTVKPGLQTEHLDAVIAEMDKLGKA